MTDNHEFGSEYHIVWQKPGSKYIAEVHNISNDKLAYRSIPVVLDDEQMVKIRMRYLTSHWSVEGPEIIVSLSFNNLPTRYKEAAVWHEVGHIHYEHPLKNEYESQEERHSVRLKAADKGMILPEESAADRFALAHVGKKTMVEFLTFLLNSRVTYGAFKWNEIAKRELEIRITAIRNYRPRRKRTTITRNTK